MSFELVVFHRGAVRVLLLPQRGVVGIGRDPELGVHIEDTSISRRHASLSLQEDDVRIHDDGSVNGTVIVRADEAGAPVAIDMVATAKSAVPVLGSTVVNPGDSICIGPAVLVLRKPEASRGSAMQVLDQLVSRIAPSPIRVLLLGETGVGKEVLAEKIHEQSPRAGKPLVKLHCAALAETLLESELFGHERGAFTGAVQARVGLIEAADEGTLFLDEVGEMGANVQVKLLRVLEDGRFQRVGSTTSREVDVRIVSATHRDLARDVKAGRFRQDLYFRLNGITLRIPPLRERRNEIPALAVELLDRAAQKSHRETPSLDDAACARLVAHSWPGNVRELRQTMERALALLDGNTLRLEHILLDETPEEVPGETSLRDDLTAIERQRVEEALLACGGNQTRAAKLLGIPRRTLVMRLREWGISRRRA